MHFLLCLSLTSPFLHFLTLLSPLPPLPPPLPPLPPPPSPPPIAKAGRQGAAASVKANNIARTTRLFTMGLRRAIWTGYAPDLVFIPLPKARAVPKWISPVAAASADLRRASRYFPSLLTRSR